MKRIRQFLVFVLATFMITLGCSKDDNSVVPKPQQKEDPKKSEEPVDSVTGAVDPVEVDVRIVIPNEVDLDLASTKLISFGKSFDVQSNGNAKALLYPEENSFVFLEDAEEKILLMAFINNSKKEISIASTAEVSLYYSLGVVFQFDGIKEKFLNEFNTIPELDAFNETLTSLFIADPNFLETDAYQNALKDKTTALMENKEVIEVTDKILISESYLKSGVGIEEKGTSSIGFRNRYRRRTHAFIYKVASKKEGEKEFTPIDGKSDIAGNNVLCDKEADIETPIGSTSTFGTIVDLAQGKLQEFILKDSEPVLLNVESDEIAAKYKVRVVGPSCSLPEKNSFTYKELEKLGELNNETFAFDIVLPVFTTALGFTDIDIQGFNQDNLNNFKSAVTSLISAYPPVRDAVSDGDYDKAIHELIQGFDTSAASTILDDILSATAALKGKPDAKIGKALKPLAIADAILLTNDLLTRILWSVCSTNSLEEWDVIATTSNVTLSPQFSSVVISRKNNHAYLEATVENNNLEEGQEFEYEWSTTGKYGFIWNLDNNQLGTSFLNGSAKVLYAAAEEYEDLPEDAEDIVFTKVYMKDGEERIFVGKDSAIVQVNATKWKIVPNGITIKGNTILPLKVVDFEGNTPSPDYKIVWNTSRRHGALEGLAGIWDQRNKNTINYECTDTQTSNGVETFTAKVVNIRKNGKEVTLGEAEATIFINNDPKKIIKAIDSEYFEINHGAEGNGVRMQHFNTFRVMPNPDAISYKIEVLDYIYKGVSQLSQITTKSWQADDNKFLRTVNDTTFYWPIEGLQNSINTISPAYGPGKAAIQGITGTAILTITIE